MDGYTIESFISGLSSGWKRLVVFYKVDENHKSTIVWPAPYVMYGNNAPALALALTIG